MDRPVGEGEGRLGGTAKFIIIGGGLLYWAFPPPSVCVSVCHPFPFLTTEKMGEVAREKYLTHPEMSSFCEELKRQAAGKWGCRRGWALKP